VHSCITTIWFALAEIRSELRYATVRRFPVARGLTRHRTMTTRRTAGALAAAGRFEAREVRSYEAAYVNGPWHWELPPRFAQGADAALDTQRPRAGVRRFRLPVTMLRGMFVVAEIEPAQSSGNQNVIMYG
jgi:hypothetical protein